jgi:hypothetical protein
MATWKVTPTWKKSCVEKTYWTKDGMTIVQETGWRWGEFFVETEDDNPPVLEEGVDIFSSGYECQDWSTDDGCWEEIEYINVPEEEQEKIQEFFDEGNSVYDLEEQGWISDDAEMFITCEMEIEKVD